MLKRARCMCSAKPDINREWWLAIARQEEIDTFLNVNWSRGAYFGTLSLGRTGCQNRLPNFNAHISRCQFFSCRAIENQQSMLMLRFAGHIYRWLPITACERIHTLVIWNEMVDFGTLGEDVHQIQWAVGTYLLHHTIGIISIYTHQTEVLILDAHQQFMLWPALPDT